MAFARFGRDSDLYIYEDLDGGFVCMRCLLTPGNLFKAKTGGEMADHVVEHERRGERVPQGLVERLRNAETDD